jgi:hypothetical protein
MFSHHRQREGERYSADKIIHAGVANHYSSDESGSLQITLLYNSSYIKIPEVQY